MLAMEAAPITVCYKLYTSLFPWMKVIVPFCVRMVSPLVRSPFTANLYDSLVIFSRVTGSRDVLFLIRATPGCLQCKSTPAL